MEKTTLISLRIPHSTLERIDDFVQKTRYPKRHGILVRIIENLFYSADYDTIKRLYTHWSHSDKKLVIDVKELPGT